MVHLLTALVLASPSAIVPESNFFALQDAQYQRGVCQEWRSTYFDLHRVAHDDLDGATLQTYKRLHHDVRTDLLRYCRDK